MTALERLQCRQAKAEDHRRLEVVPVQKEWVTAEEAQAYLSCRRDCLKSLVEKGKVRLARLSQKMVRYNLSDIRRLMMQSVENQLAWDKDQRDMQFMRQ